jgi:hypothetical protein
MLNHTNKGGSAAFELIVSALVIGGVGFSVFMLQHASHPAVTAQLTR